MKRYYGDETKKALKNFSFSTHLVKRELILAIIQIKKAAAFSNYKVGKLNLNTKNAIVKACEEALTEKLENQFPIPFFQGGAGTAINMNINEVIANRATEILKNKKIVHPNDHVNLSQSTNDVNPSALKMATLLLILDLEVNLSLLIKNLEKKSKDFKNVKKLGRTHLQDAVPTTLGDEFLSYAHSFKKHQDFLRVAKKICLTLNLGGTAIGDSINTDKEYIKQVYLELNKISKNKFIKAPNLMSKTSGQTDFLTISQIIVSLCVDFSKMANDFKFMSSGPKGGIGEIILPSLQKGSSIMPGKVNPIMPEILNQLYFLVSGNNLIIEKAVESAQMELGVMFPVIADRLLESIILTKESIFKFNKLCLMGIKANKIKCKEHLERSTAYATCLVPKLGYDLVSDLVLESISSGKNLKDIVISRNYLSEEEFLRIVGIN